MFSNIAQTICEDLKQLYPLPESWEKADHPSEQMINDALAEIYHNRGVVANEVNRKESLDHLLKFNHMMLKELGNKAPGTDMRLALSFNELGCAYMLREEYQKAEDCYRESISSMEKLDNYERWQISLPVVNLGMVYWLTERYWEANDVLFQGIKDREKKFGYNDRESFM